MLKLVKKNMLHSVLPGIAYVFRHRRIMITVIIIK